MAEIRRRKKTEEETDVSKLGAETAAAAAASNGAATAIPSSPSKFRKSSKIPAAISVKWLPPWEIQPSTEDDTLHTVLLVLITVIGFIIRFVSIAYPDEIVFDEIYFGEFASAYIKREYYFDIHPPLGKLLFALAGYLTGYDGSMTFTNIGQQFTKHQYLYLRYVSLIAGTFMPGIAYQTVRELSGGSWKAALLAGSMVCLDIAYVVSSRLILTDMMMYMFQALGVYLAVCLWRSRPMSREWWLLQVGSALALSAAGSVKWTSLSIIVAVGVRHFLYLVEVFPHVNLTKFRNIFLSFAVAAIVMATFYTFTWYMHFAVLSRGGKGNEWHDERFLSSLENTTAYTTYTGPKMGFFEKFFLLHKTMYDANQGVQAHHDWGSRWYSWPLNWVGVFSWHKNPEPGKVQVIYLAGSPSVWWFCLLGPAFFPFVAAYIFLARVMSNEDWRLFHLGSLFWITHIMSWLPFSLINRAQFIYHYIPPFYFTILTTCAVVHYWFKNTPRTYLQFVLAKLLVDIVAFWYWSPWVYATAVTDAQQVERRWISTWV